MRARASAHTGYLDGARLDQDRRCAFAGAALRRQARRSCLRGEDARAFGDPQALPSVLSRAALAYLLAVCGQCGLWQAKSVIGTAWNVIPDPGFRFYADPFPLVHHGRTYVFVEDFDRASQSCRSTKA